MSRPLGVGRHVGALALAVCVVILPAGANADGAPQAGSRASGGGQSTRGVDVTDPPPPISPATVSRGPNGRVVVRAQRLSEPLRIDGVLDEPIYATLPPISDLVQTVPSEGQPATEKTDAWVMFDDRNFYLSCRCWDSAPPDEWVANELRRDTTQLRNNDMFGAMIDTFHDRRNGFNFYTNPLGALADQIITDEGNPNTDWNPPWTVRTGRFEGGWTVEMAIPFRSLRYRSGANQEWGIQIRRAIRRKNEWTHLTRVSAANGGAQGIFRVSAAATLVGLDLPPAAKNIEVKPYAIAKLTTDKITRPPLSNDFAPSAGVDAKYGINANLTADLTVNTDFAQVEVDEQQVNLTRNSLIFPEKRDFFLEGRGIFEFARGQGGFGQGGLSASATAPTFLYTRRIGLNRGRIVPIEVGGRLSGRVGDYQIGVFNMETGDEGVSATPRTNFTVARLRRNILRRSTLGAMFTNRSHTIAGPGSNQAFGVDTSLAFYQNVFVNGYYAKTQSPGVTESDDSYQGRFEYAADRYGAKLDYLMVGDNFNPEVGLVRRDNFRRSYASARFSPRPRRRVRSVRKFTWEAGFEHLENLSGQLETRIHSGRFATEFQNSDQLTIEGSNNYELLLQPLTVATAVRIPRGSYTFSDYTVTYSGGQQRPLSGAVAIQRGQFYDGHITALTVSGARIAVLKQFSIEPSVTINNVTLPAGDFVTKLYRARLDYGFSPRMFASALVQYNSNDKTYGSNYRFRWEYIPGSEFFVVYTDERDTARGGYPDLRNKAFVVKFTRLFRF